jgi:hypothetical protein
MWKFSLFTLLTMLMSIDGCMMPPWIFNTKVIIQWTVFGISVGLSYWQVSLGKMELSYIMTSDLL